MPAFERSYGRRKYSVSRPGRKKTEEEEGKMKATPESYEPDYSMWNVSANERR